MKWRCPLKGQRIQPSAQYFQSWFFNKCTDFGFLRRLLSVMFGGPAQEKGYSRRKNNPTT